MARLIPCPTCAVHCKLSEDACPHCGSTLRDTDGKIAATAAAALLGLSLVAGACGDEVSAPEYGVPAVSTGAGTGGAGTGGESAGGDMGGTGGGGLMDAPAYGVPGVGGGGS